MQYGLPGFTELLGYAYDDSKIDPPRDSRWELDSLRDRLDPHWRVLKPRELRRLLGRYLRRIDGGNCTAYLRLARLARQGYIKAIVDMNFDPLLHRAFEILEDPKNPCPGDRLVDPSRSFQLLSDPKLTAYRNRADYLKHRVPLIIPHGSLKEKQGVPILDLAGSDLFDDQGESRAAEALFRNNDVVFLGYRGSDAKIAAALRPAGVPSDQEELVEEDYNKIYVLTLDPPDPRLLRIMVARGSTDLIVTGNAAAFETVMEELDRERKKQEDLAKAAWGPDAIKATCAERDHRPAESQSDRESRTKDLEERSLPDSRHFTRSETAGLGCCRRLAIKLRTSMSIAEGAHISIEDHATKIFKQCLAIARCAGIGLTSPEKYLLHCAAYLHDLGYFLAHSGGRHPGKSGWSLLSTHGEETATLLLRHFDEEEQERAQTQARKREPDEKSDGAATNEESSSCISIFPETYEGATAALRDTLLAICYLHSASPFPEWAGPLTIGRKEIPLGETFPVTIDSFEIRVRPHLLHVIFSTAEELSHGHPFRPSPYPQDPPRAEETMIEDPVLDLYLRQKPNLLEFELRPGVVVACPKPTASSDTFEKTRRFLTILAKSAVLQFKDLKIEGLDDKPSWGLTFRSAPTLPDDKKELEASLPGALCEALDEQLAAKLARLESGETTKTKDPSATFTPSRDPGFVSTVLDLVALYTDPCYLEDASVGTKAEENPASKTQRGLDHTSLGLQRAYDLLLEPETRRSEASKHLIYGYAEFQYWSRPEDIRHEELTLLEVFRYSFEHIYRPAWRFCADKWLYGIDSLVMARASLDLGSSRFRDEVNLGIRRLLRNKVTRCSSEDKDPTLDLWKKKDPTPSRWHRLEPWAFGHEGCTLCTSRLLYVLSASRRLLTDQMRASLGSAEDGLDGTISALLRYFLRRRRDPWDPSWCGIETEQRLAEKHFAEKPLDDNQALFSADYLAWAVKALAQVLWVDRDLRLATNGSTKWIESMLGSDGTQSVIDLFRYLWGRLKNLPQDSLLGDKTEEPHSYIIGHVANAYLFVRELPEELLSEVLDADRDWSPFAHQLQDALEEFKTHKPAQLSEFFVWPAQVFLATMAPKLRKNQQDRDGKVLVDKLEKCLKSRVWIRKGEGKGSWGYNIENTQRIVSSLNTFWTLALRDKSRFAKLFGARERWEGLLTRED